MFLLFILAWTHISSTILIVEQMYPKSLGIHWKKVHISQQNWWPRHHVPLDIYYNVRQKTWNLNKTEINGHEEKWESKLKLWSIQRNLKYVSLSCEKKASCRCQHQKGKRKRLSHLELSVIITRDGNSVSQHL